MLTSIGHQMVVFNSSSSAVTDAAFDAAFSSGRLPALSTLLQDADAIGSLLSYHILTPAPSVLLFNPTDDNPFADDFKDGAQILDGTCGAPTRPFPLYILGV